MLLLIVCEKKPIQISANASNIFFYFSNWTKKMLHRKFPVYLYGKVNLLLMSSINLVFSSLEMHRRLIQTKLYCKVFYSVF